MPSTNQDFNISSTERHLPDPSFPVLKPFLLPFWFYWPGETHSALEVSLWMLGSQSERQKKQRERWKPYREVCLQPKGTEMLSGRDSGPVSSCEKLESALEVCSSQKWGQAKISDAWQAQFVKAVISVCELRKKIHSKAALFVTTQKALESDRTN